MWVVRVTSLITTKTTTTGIITGASFTAISRRLAAPFVTPVWIAVMSPDSRVTCPLEVAVAANMLSAPTATPVTVASVRAEARPRRRAEKATALDFKEAIDIAERKGSKRWQATFLPVYYPSHDEQKGKDNPYRSINLIFQTIQILNQF